MEVAMFRYKKVIGRGLRARTLPTRKTEEGRLQGHQHHDRPRHAGVPLGRLTVAGKGEILPNADFYTGVDGLGY
jgi:hypothetical protein